MPTATGITTLFLDIGGVLLSNGWDRHARRLAAEHFDMDYEELNERHHLIFDSYEKGHLDLASYLDRVIFYQKRPFSREAFKTFMFGQSQPHPAMFDLIRRLKANYPIKIVAVNNEGRELNAHRIHAFALPEVIDFFVSSCFVHMRKPDPGIYLAALDMAQASPQQVIYCDDRAMFIEAARTLGIHGILHSSCEATRSALAAVGFALD